MKFDLFEINSKQNWTYSLKKCVENRCSAHSCEQDTKALMCDINKISEHIRQCGYTQELRYHLNDVSLESVLFISQLLLSYHYPIIEWSDGWGEVVAKPYSVWHFADMIGSHIQKKIKEGSSKMEIWEYVSTFTSRYDYSDIARWIWCNNAMLQRAVKLAKSKVQELNKLTYYDNIEISDILDVEENGVVFHYRKFFGGYLVTASKENCPVFEYCPYLFSLEEQLDGQFVDFIYLYAHSTVYNTIQTYTERQESIQYFDDFTIDFVPTMSSRGAQGVNITLFCPFAILGLHDTINAKVILDYETYLAYLNKEIVRTEYRALDVLTRENDIMHLTHNQSKCNNEFMPTWILDTNRN